MGIIIINHYKDSYIQQPVFQWEVSGTPFFFKSKWLTCFTECPKILVSARCLLDGLPRLRTLVFSNAQRQRELLRKEPQGAGSFETEPFGCRVGCYNPNILTMYK